MKITVSKSELFNKLKSIGRIIQPKNSLPAYENFLFELGEDGLLLVTAGEEGGRISTNVECKSDSSEVSFMVNAKTMLDGLKEIPEQPLTIDLNSKEKYVEICVKYSNGKFEIVGEPGKEYPAMSKEALDKPFMLDGDDFLYGVRQVQICCANDELRPVMNGVFIEKGVDSIAYVASGGSMLGLINNPIGQGEKSSFILPVKFAKLISNIMPAGCEDLTITVGKTNIVFEFETFRLMCRMIEGRYPNYRSVIPQNNNKTALFKKAELLSALKRVSVFCPISSSLIVMSFENGQLKLSGHDLDFSTSAEETVPIISYKGGPIEIGFKSTFLIELLAAIPSDDISISMLEPSKAALIKRADEEECSLTYLIMPLSINN